MLIVAAALAGCGADADPEAARAAHRQHLAEGRALHERGDPAGAVRQAARALVALPTEPLSYGLVSRLYVELDDDETAIGFFELIARDHGDLAEPWHYKGFHEFRLGRWADALQSFRRAEANAPDDPRNPFRQGLVLQTMGDFDGARERLQRAFDLDPGDAVAAARLSRVLRVTGDYDAADRIVVDALIDSPDSAELHYSLGQLRLRQGRNGEAEAALRRAIAIDRLRWDAHHDLARLLSRTGRDGEGRREGLTADRLRDYADVVGAMNRRVSERPNDPEAVLALAELELTEHNLEDAKRWMVRGRELAGPSKRLAALGLELAILDGDLARAEPLASAVRDDPGPGAGLALAAFDLATDRTEDALRRLEAAVADAPAERSFLRRAADLYAAAGRNEQSDKLHVRASAIPWDEALDVPGMRSSAP
jgi:Flp pilus assembly protein TadD